MSIPTGPEIYARFETLMARAEAKAAALPPVDTYRGGSDDYLRRCAEQAVQQYLDNLPRRFATADMADLSDDQQPDTLQAWLDDPQALTLWLFGPVGTGKTFTAAALFSEFIVRDAVRLLREERRWRARFTSVAALLDSLRGEGTDETWRDVKLCPVLVLDDFAHIRPTEWAAERLWMLTDYRVNEGLRTICTTNAAFPALRDAWGAGTMDRLTEAATSVTIAGTSRRKPFTFGDPA